MHKIVLITLLLGGCAANKVVADTDAKVRDKCDYLRSGMFFVESAVNLFGSQNYTDLARRGSAALRVYCGVQPITNVIQAMSEMEKIIVAAREPANRVQGK